MIRLAEVMNVLRSAYYEQRKITKDNYRKAKDEHYSELIRPVVDKRPSYGYQRVTAVVKKMLRADGTETINHKLVLSVDEAQRISSAKHTGRSQRRHEGIVMVPKSDQQWSSNVFEIRCEGWQRDRIAFSMDCCDTTVGITFDVVKDMMLEAVMNRFEAADTVFPKIENGTQTMVMPISAGRCRHLRSCWRLKCVRHRIKVLNPNQMAESFMKTFKRDYADVYGATDPRDLMEKLPKWFNDYNETHPHGGLKMLHPREFRKRQSMLELCPV